MGSPRGTSSAPAWDAPACAFTASAIVRLPMTACSSRRLHPSRRAPRLPSPSLRHRLRRRESAQRHLSLGPIRHRQPPPDGAGRRPRRAVRLHLRQQRTARPESDDRHARRPLLGLRGHRLHPRLSHHLPRDGHALFGLMPPMHATPKASALLLLAKLTVACETSDPTQAVLQKPVPSRRRQQQRCRLQGLVVGRRVPSAASHPARNQQRSASSKALTSPTRCSRRVGTRRSALPRVSFPVRSKGELTAQRGDTLLIPIAPSSIEGDCDSGAPLTQDQADFITQRIFPAEFAGVTYDAATCTASPLAEEGAGGAAGRQAMAASVRPLVSAAPNRSAFVRKAEAAAKREGAPILSGQGHPSLPLCLARARKTASFLKLGAGCPGRFADWGVARLDFSSSEPYERVSPLRHWRARTKKLHWPPWRRSGKAAKLRQLEYTMHARDRMPERRVQARDVQNAVVTATRATWRDEDRSWKLTAEKTLMATRWT